MTIARPQPRRIDLHLHTTRSDGAFEPAEVLARCARSGLDMIALTDHDLSSNVGPGPRQVDGRELYVIAGAELSGVHDDREYHLLAYFPAEVPAAFASFCREQVLDRAARYAQSIDNLDLGGLDGPDDEARRGERALTRHHLARELVRAGHAKTVRDAFERYLGNRHGAVPALRLPFVDAIRVARAHGAITSWAHPPLGAVERYLQTFVDAGLHGLEGMRPALPGSVRKTYKKAAKRHGLVLTGGSDWHGWPSDGDLGLFSVHPSEVQGFLDALYAA